VAEEPRRRRRDPLLEIPGARVNPIHAGQSRVWAADAAAAYSLGLDPCTVTPDIAERYRSVSALAREYLRRLQVIQEALVAGELVEPLRPVAVLRWAGHIPFPFPRKLAAAVRDVPLARPSLSGLTGVDPRIHQSALLILGSIAIDEWNFNPAAPRNQATGKVRGAIERRGLHIDDQTILDRLREAVEVVRTAIEKK
jgi:hypothetical protein